MPFFLVTRTYVPKKSHSPPSIHQSNSASQTAPSTSLSTNPSGSPIPWSDDSILRPSEFRMNFVISDGHWFVKCGGTTINVAFPGIHPTFGDWIFETPFREALAVFPYPTLSARTPPLTYRGP
ncbi:hypothetical protein L211DRAFT_31859 [Terfezia boudieri ATCC MYA-4762]|uniref:Uncharacterized protein n=1 Tax=Terfezia boudieri ATCC MYA-4762 TaxID=1051890 RepID=A0A3N4M3M5_9PEZI|nr:hypothetical protein L211DRAFT_31859 [Terfezia boudieri ATCC MYA-4762]